MKDMYSQFSSTALLYISSLKKSGVDFASAEYVKNEEFKKLTTEYLDESLGLTMSWVVERAAVSPDLLEKIYGVYSMCVEYSHTDKKFPYNKTAFFSYLTSTDGNEIFKGYFPDLYQNIKTISEVEFYFFRNSKDSKTPKGIKYKLKDWGIDVDLFNDRESEFKLYFLFFLTEHNPDLLEKYSKSICGKGHINIFKFLSNPTTENADRTELGIKSANKDIIQFLKSEVIKGIPLDYAYRVKKAFETITEKWNQILKVIQSHSYKCKNIDSTEYLQKIHKLWDYFWCDDQSFFGEFREELLETFYLKLREHEHLGIERDLMLSYDNNENYESSEINLKILEYTKVSNKYITIDKIEEHLTVNRKTYACILFQTDKITSNQFRTYDTACKTVMGFVHIQWSNSTIPINALTELQILVMLNEYIKQPRNMKIDNKFFLHDSNEPRNLKADIPNGNEAFGINQFAWFDHIVHVLGCYQNHNDLDYYLIKKDVSKILQSIYQANSLYDMIVFHEIAYNYFQKFTHVDKLSTYYEIFNSIMDRYDFEMCENDDVFLLLFADESNMLSLKTIANDICKQISTLKESVIVFSLTIKFIVPFEIPTQSHSIPIAVQVKVDKTRKLVRVDNLFPKTI